MLMAVTMITFTNSTLLLALILFFHIIVIFKVAEPAFCGIATLISYQANLVTYGNYCLATE
jgi:hypothetical protein